MEERKMSEILKQLLCMAYDYDSEGVDISLAEGLELYGKAVLSEQKKEQKEAHREKPAAGKKETEPSDKLAAKGPGAAKKQEVYARLRAWRERGGSECYDQLTKASAGALTAKEIMKMNCGTVAPLQKWTALNEAMDRLEKGAADR